MKKVSIILIDWKARESFHSIEYLNNQAFPRDEYEIIWVEYYDHYPQTIRNHFENGSIDKWIVLGMEDMYFKHLLYNEGVAAATGDIICICDSDAIFSPTFVKVIVDTFEANKSQDIVLYLDQVRNNDQSYYPFKYATWEDIMNSQSLENWDYDKKKPRGLTIEYKPEYVRNYGACVCAKRDSVIELGGFDEHDSYHCFICGPYELGWRMVNRGYKEIWHQEEWLLHVWHPWIKEGVETVGYHDGVGLNQTALELRRSKRVMPHRENEKIRKLRLEKRGDIKEDYLENKNVIVHYENSPFINKFEPRLDDIGSLYTFYRASRIKRLLLLCENYEEGEKLFHTLKSTQLVNYVEILLYGHHYMCLGKEKMLSGIYNTCKHFKPELIVFIPVKDRSNISSEVEPSSALLSQVADELGIRNFVYDMENEGRLVEFESFSSLAGINDLSLENGNDEKSTVLFPDMNLEVYKDLTGDRDIDVLFCGSVIEDSYRGECIRFLIENGINVYTRLHRLPEQVYANYLSRAKISLSIPGDNDRISGLERRALEIMSCNSLLLEDASLNTSYKYQAGKDFVTFENKVELLDKVRYYLSHSKERLEIAASGQKKTMENYNARALWEEFLKKSGFESYCNNELARREDNRLLKNNRLVKLDEIDKSEFARVAIFGAAATGIKCHDILKNKGIDVPFFVDNSTERQGTSLLGVPVYSPECLTTDKYDLIDGIVIGIGGDSQWVILQLKELLFDKAIITLK